MGEFHTTYLVFHISIAIVCVIVYLAVEYYVVPELIEKEDRPMVAKYADYGLTAALALLGIGSLLSTYLDTKYDDGFIERCLALTKKVGGRIRWR
jgi:hypothetical protein